MHVPSGACKLQPQHSSEISLPIVIYSTADTGLEYQRAHFKVSGVIKGKMQSLRTQISILSPLRHTGL